MRGGAGGAVTLDAALRDELVAMVHADFAVRDRLAADGSLYHGYHPEMRSLHEAHADRLAAILDQHGWPGPDLVGGEGHAAAWLVAQHAISRPALMRRVRDLTHGTGQIHPTQWAMLDDRIAVFEGRAQLYGTQFDWDAEGIMNPLPIADPAGVEARRAKVGLPPLAETLAQHRANSGPAPADPTRHARDGADFARAVGWRDWGQDLPSPPMQSRHRADDRAAP